MTVTADDFPAFYQQINDMPPFPWQDDLVHRILDDGGWPQLIDVPTGMGKTALLDVAVFIAAATADVAGPDRTGRRRTFFVVDRRLVVDEAYDRASRLSAALNRALDSGEDTVARRVAHGLRALAPRVEAGLSIPAPVPVEPAPRDVLPVTRMRGGLTWDAAWLDRPDVPGIVVGTVDQVGSRLLFRGYGVSERRMSIDAALVGTDSLILVDEAHLADAMVTTVTDAYRRDREGLGLPRTEIVRMTATAGDNQLRRYAFDVEAHRDNDVAWRRLTAPKQLSLVSSDRKSVVQTIADNAAGLLTHEHDTVLVVCNTVDRARQVHDALVTATMRRRDGLEAEVDLLIGRSRPADREQLVRRLTERFGVERYRGQARTPAILIATQTVEVGANFDADGLVTESAPWDSIVQRLGRLNRFGNCSDTARAVVVHDGVEDGPVYGAARDATWAFLQSRVSPEEPWFNVSPLACRNLQAVPKGVFASRLQPPLLTIPILDCWVRTGPVPVPDTPVAPYLHGLGPEFATVSIAWRSGLVDPDPTGEDAERSQEDLSADLAALPIRSEELVEVPLYAARRWLAGESTPPLSDLDADVQPQLRASNTREPFRVLAWRSDALAMSRQASATNSRPTASWVWIDAGATRPGDVLVVPCERGGLDRYGWAPACHEPVIDVSEAIRARPEWLTADAWGRRRIRPLLRIDLATPMRLGLAAEDAQDFHTLVREVVRDFSVSDRSEAEAALPAHLAAAVGRVLDGATVSAPQDRIPGMAWTPQDLSVLQAWLEGPVTLAAVHDGQGRVPERFVLSPSTRALYEIERDDELPECSSMGLGRVALNAHHANVGDRARDIAEALGLAPTVSAAVEAAARWHDLGKCEPRFQAMLCGGDEYESMLLDDGPLAKSGLHPADRSAYRAAHRRSGLPAGARHEAWSASLLGTYLSGTSDLDGLDYELVLHLVASHHGHARPWLPPVVDHEPRQVSARIDGPPNASASTTVSVSSAVTVDFGQPARFTRLNRTYGRWGLALLETIVRCADMTVSGDGS